MTSGTIGDMPPPEGIREIRTRSRRATRDGQTHVDVYVLQDGKHHRFRGKGSNFETAFRAVKMQANAKKLRTKPE